MQYKTIALELLEQNTLRAEQLRKERQLLAMTEQLAVQLRERHLELTTLLKREHRDGESSVISSQAMEMAIAELQEQFPIQADDQDSETITTTDSPAVIPNPSSAD